MNVLGAERRVVVRRPQKQIDEVEFARTRLGFEPDEAQALVLRSRAKRVILNCARQWGKSTVTAAKALYRAAAIGECLVLVASPSKRQSAEWMRKLKRMAARAGIGVRGDGDNAVSLLKNGSRIVGLPGVPDTTRGFSAASLVVIDEAARVRDDLYESLRPVLMVSNGDIWMMSTPRGKSGFFYETWAYGGPEWLKVSGPATECARMPREFLEEQRSVMTAAAFRQEHMCEFVGQGAGLFDRELVERMLDDEVEPFDL
jgi:hypothetical protein